MWAQLGIKFKRNSLTICKVQQCAVGGVQITRRYIIPLRWPINTLVVLHIEFLQENILVSNFLAKRPLDSWSSTYLSQAADQVILAGNQPCGITVTHRQVHLPAVTPQGAGVSREPLRQQPEKHIVGQQNCLCSSICTYCTDITAIKSIFHIGIAGITNIQRSIWE